MSGGDWLIVMEENLPPTFPEDQKPTCPNCGSADCPGAEMPELWMIMLRLLEINPLSLAPIGRIRVTLFRSAPMAPQSGADKTSDPIEDTTTGPGGCT